MSKEIELTQGKAATVDDPDYKALCRFKWYASCINGRWYASRSVRRPPDGPGAVRMHRSIVKPAPGLEVDHINGNGLDNRRANLRAVSHVQNVWNLHKTRRSRSSRFVGVSLADGRWRATICFGSRSIHLGMFSREVDAALAYDAKCRELRGPFARPNFTVVVPRSRLRQLLSRTGGRFFSACFIKRTDGSERVIHCRTNVHPSPVPSVIQITDYHDLLTVWDVTAREFRSIPIEGILWIRLNKTYIRPRTRRDRSALDVTTQGHLFARTAG